MSGVPQVANGGDGCPGRAMRSGRRRRTGRTRSAFSRSRLGPGYTRRSTSLRAFLKMCEEVEGNYRIRPAHPVIVRFPIER
jgi:hypothetical protein